MKSMTPAQLELAKFRAAVAAASLQGDPDRAEEFQDMSIEEYAAERGIEIIDQNPAPAILALVNPNQKPKKGIKPMPRESQAGKIRRLQGELDEANERIEELESERLDALEALGVEIIDDDDDDESEEDDDSGNGEED
jgi:hypothetical protein